MIEAFSARLIKIGSSGSTWLSIQAELASLRYDEIGGLYQDERALEFFIGPETETMKGP